MRREMRKRAWKLKAMGDGNAEKLLDLEQMEVIGCFSTEKRTDGNSIYTLYIYTGLGDAEHDESDTRPDIGLVP